MTFALVLALAFSATGAVSPDDPVILDFHATWCGPCQQMRPAVEKLRQAGYPVQSVDVDQQQSLAARYHVGSIPCFVIVDSAGTELARTEGLQPAAKLAALYHQVWRKTRKAAPSATVAEVAPRAPPEPPEPLGLPAPIEAHSAAWLALLKLPAPPPLPAVPALVASPHFAGRSAPFSATDSEGAKTALPRPWETAVRIRVFDPAHGMIGYGSGTIIHSTPEESIIVTCAHIFHIADAHTQPLPARFPRRIMVDLFDGKLQGAGVRYVASVEGWAVDYDYTTDVGLIRIRPGRELPSARVVPPDWRPQSRLSMITVGCSEGRDATAWATRITNPNLVSRIAGREYDAIECANAPAQGRSGGGLYTTDGHLAGVCDFAEPVGNVGLYASPRSIYKLLDRCNLTALYRRHRADRGEQLADRDAPGRRDVPPVPLASPPTWPGDVIALLASAATLALACWRT